MTLQTPFALATLCFLATDAMGAVRPVVFAPPTHYAIGTNVYHLCSGDFNGDQALDLAALTGDNSGGRQITLWTNDGRGKFAVRTNQPLAGVGRAMAAGDVMGTDGDSRMDVPNGDHQRTRAPVFSRTAWSNRSRKRLSF